jgi:isopentenyl-diphosphate delta-isomerase
MSSTTTTTLTQTEPITASNVLTLFPDVDTTLVTTPSNPTSANTSDNDLAGYDEEQIRLMDEVCIVLSPEDVPIGTASKKTCHLMSNISRGLLHRAFSVFLFDPNTSKLLLQQRASEKITFPDMWTNTCCSHPLGVAGEIGEGLEESVMGVKRAAQRKLGQELGIPKQEVPVGDFEWLTRIHYLAGCGGDGKWGEHESETPSYSRSFFARRLRPLLPCWHSPTYCLPLWYYADPFLVFLVDYILFIRPSQSVTLDINPNEVQETRYVDAEELKEMFKDEKLTFTPWFKLICNSMLFEWWDAMLKGELEKYKGEKGIRRML